MDMDTDIDTPGAETGLEDQEPRAQPCQHCERQGPIRAVVAFRIREVLQLVASYLSPSDLAPLRLTCTFWNSVFIPHIRARHIPVRLYSYPKMEGLIIFSNNPWRYIGDFMETMKHSRDLPFSRYQVCVLAGHQVDEFFSDYGSSVQSLFLRAFRPNSDATAKFKEIICGGGVARLAPNLAELLFTTGTGLSTGDLSPPPSNILNEIPHLKKAVFRITHTPNHPWYDDLLTCTIRAAVGLTYLEVDGRNYNLTALTALQTSANVGTLRRLKMYELNADELKILLSLTTRKRDPMRLEEFSTSILHPDRITEDTARLLYTFLSLQAGTLCRFKIRLEKEPKPTICMDEFFPLLSEYLEEGGVNPATVTVSPVCLPSMPKLHTLAIKRHGLRFEVGYETGSMAANFPALKKLVLEDTYHEFDLKGATLKQRVAHPTVTHVELGTFNLTQVGALLPAVTRCELTPCPNSTSPEDTFNTLWTAWPALERARLTSPRYLWISDLDLDEHLTGVPRTCLETLSRGQEIGSSSAEKARDSLCNYKTKPGMGDLVHLQELTLSLGDRVFNFSDYSGYYGVMAACPSLQRFTLEWKEVRGKGKVSFSPECLAAVRSARGAGFEFRLCPNGPCAKYSHESLD